MLAGKVALCVGATSGIGKGIAYTLALMKADVAIAARNEDLGNRMVGDLRKINPDGKYELIKCDASSMKSIRAASADFNSKFSKLNYLVMSQGIATLEGRNETSEGIDNKMALHYYGKVQFVKELEDVIKSTAENEDVRVASVLSGGVHSPYDNLQDLELKYNYGLGNAANAAGFFNDLGLDQLSREFSGPHGSNISFIHAAPGFVNTSWGKDFPWILRTILGALKVFATSPEQYGEVFVNNALIGKHMGAPVPETCASDASESGAGSAAVVYNKAGFHTMNPKGEEGKLTSLHNDKYREAVWKHTNELLAAALNK